MADVFKGVSKAIGRQEYSANIWKGKLALEVMLPESAYLIWIHTIPTY